MTSKPPDQPSRNERKVRAALPLIRWMAAYLPVSLVRGLMRVGELARRLPPGLKREAVVIEGVSGEWLIPEGSPDHQVLLYLHGGGFVYGWSQMHRAMVADLARRSGARTLAVAYRLAPEHPFPAALHDCLAVYRSLLRSGFSAENIVIAGDSAGANLTLSTILAARDDGLRLPAGAVCLSPVVDFDKKEEMQRGVAGDALLHPLALLRFRDAYVNGHPESDPLLSPIHGDLSCLPALLIQAGEDEFFVNDARRLAEAAQTAGVAVRIEIYPRMWHVWQIFLDRLPQADHALERIAAFVRERFAGPHD